MPEWRNALDRLKSRRWLRWVAGVFAAIVVLMALIWLAGPPLLRGRIEQAVSEELQRPVKIGRLALNPLTLAFPVDPKALADRFDRRRLAHGIWHRDAEVSGLEMPVE